MKSSYIHNLSYGKILFKSGNMRGNLFPDTTWKFWKRNFRKDDIFFSYHVFWTFLQTKM